MCLCFASEYQNMHDYFERAAVSDVVWGSHCETSGHPSLLHSDVLISPNQGTAVRSKLHAYFVNLMQNKHTLDHLKFIFNTRGNFDDMPIYYVCILHVCIEVSK